MDRANGSDAAGQSKQMQPQANESGRSEHDLAQPQQSTPPARPSRPAIQRKESQHQQHAQQRLPKQQHDKTTSNNGASHLRLKNQKHLVGGGMSSTRLHARVPSSKALHKSSSNKAQQQQQQQQQQQLQLQQLQQLQELQELQHFQQLQQQQLSYHRSRTSGASDSPTHPADPGSQHRRSTSGSENKLMRGGTSSSATSLVRRNVSASSLKRNKSHADVSKRNGNARPSGNLKRNRGLASPIKKKAGVHFEIGSPDAHEDEWVDAGSSNVSGSRKNSLVYGDDTQEDEAVAQPKDETEDDDNDDDDDDDEEEQIILQPPPKPKESKESKESMKPTQSATQPPTLRPSEQDAQRPSSSASNTASLLRTTSTSRLLPRTPPGAAPPMMSTETVTVTHNNMQSSSPDVSPTRAQHPADLPSGSADREVMTSRFITTGSHESTSNATAGDSYYTSSSSRPGTARNDRDTPKSSNAASVPSNLATPLRARRKRSIGGDIPQLSDDDDSGIAASADGRSSATAGGSHPRRTRAAYAPPAELSRTQQKLNLERASSNIDRSNRQQGPAAGPLLGAGESGTHDPRISKLMERTGMEYYVVRRYQNPVTRSIARLSSRIEADKNVRIPANGSVRSSPSKAVNAAAAGRSSSGGAGLSQSFRERDMRRNALQSATAAAGNGTMPPLTRARTYGAGANGSGGNGAELGSPYQPQQQRLSGTSLVEGYDEDSTAALLRNLWDKHLYLGTSQD